MPKRQYPVVIHKDATSDFGVTLADFPATCGGSTPEQALANAEVLLSEVVADYLQHGTPLPEPTSILALPVDLTTDAVMVSLISVTLPGPSKRIAVTMDPDLIDAIDGVTSNRSGFLAAAARTALERLRHPS